MRARSASFDEQAARPRVLKPGDIVQIESSVDGLGNRRSVVEPDGKLPLGPRWGRVSIGGKNLEECEDTIRKQVAEDVRTPEVQVTYGGNSLDGSSVLSADPLAHVIARLKRFERDLEEFKSLVREIRALKGR